MVRKPRPFNTPTVSANVKFGKCVLLGTQAVGKTYLLKAFARRHPEDIYSARMENRKFKVTHRTSDGELVERTHIEPMPDELTGEYIPTAQCNEYILEGAVDNQPLALSIWDTPCIDGWTDEEDQARQAERVKIYPGTNFFVMCFCAVSPSSLDMVKTKWYPEIKEYAADAYIILVAMKIELRKDEEILKILREQNLTPTTYEDGERVAREIGAVKYLECNIFERESVVRVLEEITSLI